MVSLARTLLTPAFCAAMAGAAAPKASSDGTIAEVFARRETETLSRSHGDDADDIAIWIDHQDPSRSLIVGTNKKLGLTLFDLEGHIRAFVEAGKINNVDLRNDIIVDGERRTVVAASDGNDKAAMISLYLLDTSTPNLIPIGRVPGGDERAYGFCLYQHEGKLWAFNVFRNGAIEQVSLDLATKEIRAKAVRTLKLKSNAEGCVADDRTKSIYVAERDTAIWRWGADPDASSTPTLIASADKSRLVPDIEGLAIAAYGNDGGYLVASSQGSDSYVLYRLDDNSFAGRFRIADGGLDGTSHTDGIELVIGDFGPNFPGGLFVAQDNDNRPNPQNFKLLAWTDIANALHISPNANARGDPAEPGAH
ncbi:phytase [Aquisediminimonas profunda]|uniref:phytase n=1 Tax=Aquisediminimonas profunda TaxID=1550733 RepID=UPI003CCEAB77